MSVCRTCGSVTNARSGQCPVCDLVPVDGAQQSDEVGPLCGVCGVRKDSVTRMCPTCDAASFIASPEEQHLYALMSGATKQVRRGSREGNIPRFRFRPARSGPSRFTTLKARRVSRPAALVSGVIFLGAVVFSLTYTVSQAGSVLWPVVERQQEALREFLSEARDYAEEWKEQAQGETLVADPPSAPPEREEASTQRILPEVVTDAVGPHAFLSASPRGEPDRFDPCRPIFWTINPEREPDGARELLTNAFDTISGYTGLSFQFVGETGESWAPRRDPKNDVYRGVGDWKPVGVWWMEDPQISAAYTLLDPETDPSGIAGFAGPQAMSYDQGASQFVSVSGEMVLNATVARELIRGGSAREVTWIMWHEIGHLVGLDHSDEDGQLMNSQNQGFRPELSAGDREGFARAGAGPCLGNRYPTAENYVPYYTTPSVVYVDRVHEH